MIGLGIIAASKRRSAPSAGPLVSDSFDRPNGVLGVADTGQAWINATPGLVIYDGRITRGSAPGIAVIDAGQPDVHVSCDVHGGMSYTPTITIRADATASTRYSLLRLTTNRFLLVRVLSGTSNDLPRTFDYTTGDRVGLSAKEEGGGTTLRAWLNGVEQWSYIDTNTTRPMGTHVGVGISSNSVRLDNFIAEAI